MKLAVACSIYYCDSNFSFYLLLSSISFTSIFSLCPAQCFSTGVPWAPSKCAAKFYLSNLRFFYISVPPNFLLLTLVCRELKKVENHWSSKCCLNGNESQKSYFLSLFFSIFSFPIVIWMAEEDIHEETSHRIVN